MLPFLEDHGPTLFRLIYRVTWNEAAAEDLMQDLFLKLSVSRKFRLADCPLAYARRAALHLAFDWRRKRKERADLTPARDVPLDMRPSPLDRLVDAERTQAVLDAMAVLSTRGRELLTLHYIQEQSYQALAQEYHKSPHQIRALCHKALVQLRKLLLEMAHPHDRGELP